MDAEIKKKWTDALRSGAFSQARGQLRDRGQHCCLGVLCVVTGITIDETGLQVLSDGNGVGYRPIEKLTGAKLHALFRMNDTGSTFPEIADYIEANL